MEKFEVRLKFEAPSAETARLVAENVADELAEQAEEYEIPAGSVSASLLKNKKRKKATPRRG